MKKNGLGFACIDSFVKATRKGQLGVYLVAVVSCDSKFKASGRQWLGRVFKVTLVSNARLGCTFEGKTNAMLGNGEHYVSGPLNGMIWLDFPYFKQGIKSGKIVLSLCYRACDARTTFDSYYILDGRLATAAEVALIESDMRSSGGESKKQANMGIENKKQTKVVQYDVNDIIHLSTTKDDAIDAYNGVI